MLAKQNKPIYTESVTIKLQLIFHYEERKDLEEPGLKEMKIMTHGQTQSVFVLRQDLIQTHPPICKPGRPSFLPLKFANQNGLRSTYTAAACSSGFCFFSLQCLEVFRPRG